MLGKDVNESYVNKSDILISSNIFKGQWTNNYDIWTKTDCNICLNVYKKNNKNEKMNRNWSS